MTVLTDSTLEFIASGNPDLDTTFLEVSDGLWDTILETILNSSGAEQMKVTFRFRGDSMGLSFTIFERI